MTTCEIEPSPGTKQLAACMPEFLPGLMAALETLESCVRANEELTDHLLDGLQPFLTAKPTLAQSDGNSAVPGMSPITWRVTRVADKLRVVNDQLQDLVDRLEAN